MSEVTKKLHKFEYITRIIIEAEDEHMADGKLEIKLRAVFGDKHQYDVFGCVGEIKD